MSANGVAGDIRDGRGDASHRQLLKDIENVNVLTGGCVFRSLPHYTVHATEQMIRRNVRQNTEPFSTWGNSGLVEPRSGSGDAALQVSTRSTSWDLAIAESSPEEP